MCGPLHPGHRCRLHSPGTNSCIHPRFRKSVSRTHRVRSLPSIGSLGRCSTPRPRASPAASLSHPHPSSTARACRVSAGGRARCSRLRRRTLGGCRARRAVGTRVRQRRRVWVRWLRGGASRGARAGVSGASSESSRVRMSSRVKARRRKRSASTSPDWVGSARQIV